MYLTPVLLGLLCLGGTSEATPGNIEAAAEEAFSAVPGDFGFVFTEITRDGIRPLYQHLADKRLAVGSSFKLYILGTLIEEVNQGRREAADTMRLERRLQGPPHSEMASWPLKMPVTLNTLALKMISVSDNTATDHLHFLLGRETIEQQMARMGHGNPAVNRPLLNTREMTMLRDRKRGMPGKAYQTLDEAQRRQFLTELDRGLPEYESLDFDTAAFGLAEWYASPMDMARAMAWIHHHTQAEMPAHGLRQVLTVEPKLALDPRVWTFVGFKGGSEEQLVAGNWLLQHRGGGWFTYHVFFNNPNGTVKPEQIALPISNLLDLIEPTLK